MDINITKLPDSTVLSILKKEAFREEDRLLLKRQPWDIFEPSKVSGDESREVEVQVFSLGNSNYLFWRRLFVDIKSMRLDTAWVGNFPDSEAAKEHATGMLQEPFCMPHWVHDIRYLRQEGKDFIGTILGRQIPIIVPLKNNGLKVIFTMTPVGGDKWVLEGHVDETNKKVIEVDFTTDSKVGVVRESIFKNPYRPGSSFHFSINTYGLIKDIFNKGIR